MMFATLESLNHFLLLPLYASTVKILFSLLARARSDLGQAVQVGVWVAVGRGCGGFVATGRTVECLACWRRSQQSTTTLEVPCQW